jgi:parallel beta-helix repeat protein
MGRWIPVLLFLFSTGHAAAAATCGGGVACQCGDTVVSSYTLPANLGPCPGHGLLVKSQATLDCQGRRITGAGTGSERYGIYVRGDTGAEVRGAGVRNCEVTGFYHGIRLRAAEDSEVLNSRAYANGDFSAHAGYGIDVTVGSRNNLLRGNAVHGNADEGIHLASGTGPNRLVDNVVFDNYREQLYVFESHGNTLIGNTAHGTGSNSLYLKDSSDNHLEGNTFRDRTARVTGDAAGNVFLDNTFVNAQFQFRVYEASPNRVPVDNVVLGGSMRHPSGNCLRFTSARDNLVADVVLEECDTEVLAEGTAGELSSNTVVGMALSPGKVSVDSHSALAIGWWLTVRVEDQAGVPVSGARVVARDSTGSAAFDLVTGSSGTLTPQAIVEAVRMGGSTAARMPHSITTTRQGFVSAVETVDVGQHTDLTVVLSSSGSSGGDDGDGDGGGTGGGGGGTGGGGPGSLADSFDRPDSGTLGNGWLTVSGELGVVSGELRTLGTRGAHLAVIPSLAGATQSLSADFTSVDNSRGPRFGIVLRYQDPWNYYLAYRTVGGASFLRISSVVDGIERVLGSKPVSNPKVKGTFGLTASASQDSISLALNGATRLTVSDSTLVTGSLGIFVMPRTFKGQRVDNVIAEAQ